MINIKQKKKKKKFMVFRKYREDHPDISSSIMLINMFNILDHSINPLFFSTSLILHMDFLGNYRMYIYEREMTAFIIILYIFHLFVAKKTGETISIYTFRYTSFDASKMISQCIRGDGKQISFYFNVLDELILITTQQKFRCFWFNKQFETDLILYSDSVYIYINIIDSKVRNQITKIW